MPGVSDRDCHAALAGLLRASSSRSPGASAAEVVLRLLSGIRYGVRRVAVGEDGHSGRVRRHGEHEQGLPRNGRLPSVRSVLTVTVAGGGIRWRIADSEPFGTNTIWPLPRRGRDGPRWCLMPAVAPGDHRPHHRVGRGGPGRRKDGLPPRRMRWHARAVGVRPPPTHS